MNLPNILTLLRFFLTGIFIFFACQNSLSSAFFALLAFSAAALTDYFDGYYARKHNLITDFGKLMDPIADKFLMLSAFGIFAVQQIFPMWMFVVIAIREIGITVWRIIAAHRGITLAAEKTGKIKTVCQIAVAIFILFVHILVRAGMFPQRNADLMAVLICLIWVWMGLVVVLTVWSGAEVLRKSNEKVVGAIT
ncbi:MAG: CDP-diacylglycerol--glycerol-3-phosphate 3-phosphatidyltransferase [Candidatus Omnitrophica bacterium]|nr:CDP-diacylglycerol--glycerol-3-phosphate 3-phosphatidyltransferase [Candidatus Omnitrophota bacterium]